MTDKITEWNDRVIEHCNQFDDRALHPGIACICTQCQSDFGMTEKEMEEKPPADEGGFSWHSCECCGSHLGGDRFVAHGFVKGELCHESVCVDCLMYLANGDLPERVD